MPQSPATGVVGVNGVPPPLLPQPSVASVIELEVAVKADARRRSYSRQRTVSGPATTRQQMRHQSASSFGNASLACPHRLPRFPREMRTLGVRSVILATFASCALHAPVKKRTAGIARPRRRSAVLVRTRSQRLRNRQKLTLIFV
ncbi:MAG TPA: hypothetical protein VLC06_24600 [Polyangia bacterium]|nr:hypothetical protein [Polyangia bacterium]